MSGCIHGGWTDAKIFHRNLIVLPCQEIAVAWQDPKDQTAWRQEVLEQACLAFRWCCRAPKMPCSGQRPWTRTGPHIYMAWFCDSSKLLMSRNLSFLIWKLKIIIPQHNISEKNKWYHIHIYTHTRIVNMYNACCTVKCTTNVRTLLQSYNFSTIRFIKATHIWQDNPNFHTSPFEHFCPLDHTPLSCISCAYLGFGSWND